MKIRVWQREKRTPSPERNSIPFLDLEALRLLGRRTTVSAAGSFAGGNHWNVGIKCRHFSSLLSFFFLLNRWTKAILVSSFLYFFIYICRFIRAFNLLGFIWLLCHNIMSSSHLVIHYSILKFPRIELIDNWIFEYVVMSLISDICLTMNVC